MGSSISSQRGGSTSEDGRETQNDAPRDERNVEGRPHEEDRNENAREMSHDPSMSKARFMQLNHALHQLARLQREAITTQIKARETRRKAVLKRQNVWACDDNFMREVQSLLANGKLTGFDELIRLANSCQNSRDGLGPVEQENIEAEQQWEGQAWNLQQTEDKLLSGFANECQDAETYSMATTSSISGQPERSADAACGEELDLDMPNIDEVYNDAAFSVLSSATSHLRASPSIVSPIQIDVTFSRNSMLSDLIIFNQTLPAIDDSAEKYDSGIEDIDGPLEHLPPQDSFGPGIPLPKRDYASTELYPQLLSDFTSGRDRINRWLMNTSLVSRLEALSLFTCLRIQLEADDRPIPLNWAQLVVAFWELDGAAIPSFSSKTKFGRPNGKPQISISLKDSKMAHNPCIDKENLQASDTPLIVASNTMETHSANAQSLDDYHANMGIADAVPKQPGSSVSLSLPPPSSPHFQQCFDIGIIPGEDEKVLEEPP